MPAKIQIRHMFAKCAARSPGRLVVDTTSKGGLWSDLSPFKLGPVDLYGGYRATNVENAWQFAKVYGGHVAADGCPTEAYWSWARSGWSDPKPRRYPMGKGAVPEFSWWDGNALGYIDARKVIYGPLYAEAVQKTPGWGSLVEAYRKLDEIVLRDYDGYDHDSLMMSLSEVLNNSRRKMGHAFVLKMLLTNDPALSELHLRVAHG